MRIDHFVGPTLQSVTSTGKKKFWLATIFSDDGTFIQKTWWQEGGTVQRSTPVEIFGKNISKSNETNPLQQAEADLVSIYTKRRDKGYSEDGSDTHIRIKPMLAHKFRDRSHKIEWPALAQPKLDGYRMLMDGQQAWTRGGKDHVAECVAHLMFDTGGIVLDGELMLPGNRPLQESSRAIKKFRPGVSDTLIYWVYDLVDCADFRVRSERVVDLLHQSNTPLLVRIVPTYVVHNRKELMDAHWDFSNDGFEGTIVRNMNGSYAHNRSVNLQKIKEFQDAEFLIVDIVEGRGSFKGLGILVLQVEDETFEAVPRGPMEYKAKLFENKERYIGEWYTVRYQSLSEKGIPVGNTVGIDFRDNGTF